MKSNFSFSTLFLVAGLSLLVSACPQGEDETSMEDTLLLAALASSNPNSALSPQQQKATVAANAAVGASSAAASAASMTAHNEHQKMQQMVAGYLANGRDPVYIREAMAEYLSKDKDSVELAAITVTSSSGTQGNMSYTFSGTVDGYAKITMTYDLSTYMPYITSPCEVTYDTLDTTTPQGTAEFVNGSLAYNGSYTSGTYSGSSTGSATINFSNYGTMYIDQYSYAKWMKDLFADPLALAGQYATDPCEAMKSMYASIYEFYSFATLGGDINYNTTSNYSGTSSSGSYSASSSFSTVLNSANGLVVDNETVTFTDFTYAYDSTFSASSGALSGSMTITFSGTIDDWLQRP